MEGTSVLDLAPVRRTCRVCGCTDDEACLDGPCAWLTGEVDLCDSESCKVLIVAPSYLRAVDFAQEHDLPDDKWTFVALHQLDRVISRTGSRIIALLEGWRARRDWEEVEQALSFGLHMTFPREAVE